MRKITAHTVDPHSYTVVLWQQTRKLFTVTYGQHIVRDLNHDRAAKEFGECIMHAVSCAGLLKE